MDAQTRIGPKSKGSGSWKAKDWQDAKKNSDWPIMIQIFEDRINGRYLNFIRETAKQPYSGFVVMSLGCALLETLHLFYKGLKNSNAAKWECGHRMNNAEFYVLFLSQSSFVFKDHFKNKKHAETFYDHFRCGLIHQAETKDGSKIHRKKGSQLFEPVKRGLIIYRETFVDLLRQEIKKYLNHLKDDDIPTLRDSFVRKMDFICQVEFEEE